MATIEVDIELEDFSDDEIITEVTRRGLSIDLDEGDLENSDVISEVKSRLQNGFTPSQKQQLLTILHLNGEQIKNETLDDSMKIQHLVSIWDKYTSADIEKLLP